MGDFLIGLTQNRLLLAAIAAWLIAQVLKTILVLILEKELNLGHGLCPGHLGLHPLWQRQSCFRRCRHRRLYRHV